MRRVGDCPISGYGYGKLRLAVGLLARWVGCSRFQVVRMAQVRRSSCACTVCADTSRLQLACSYRLVSSRCTHRSLRRPFLLVSYAFQRRLHQSGPPNRPLRLLTRLAHSYGSLALCLGWMSSSRRRAALYSL